MKYELIETELSKKYIPKIGDYFTVSSGASIRKRIEPSQGRILYPAAPADAIFWVGVNGMIDWTQLDTALRLIPIEPSHISNGTMYFKVKAI